MRERTQWLMVGLLTALVIASAFAVVVVRHLNRVEFYALERQLRERDTLSIEWRQLMTEMATWRMEHSVEAEAREKGGMRVPEEHDMQVLVVPGARG